MKFFNLRLVTSLIGAGLFGVLLLAPAGTSVEATSGAINSTMNFQGRLLTAAGAVVPDGNYNIEFKLYKNGDGTVNEISSGGSLLWTEDWLVHNTQGVVVKNGYFSVQLGSITSLPSAATLDESVLWLSMNVAGGANTTANCTPFSSCTPDGEMLPMRPLGAAPYAINAANANTLGGLSATGFIQNVTTPQTGGANFDFVSAAIGNVGGQIQAAASGTAAVLVLKDGSSSSGDLLQLQGSGSSTPIARFDSSGNLDVASTIDTQSGTTLSIAGTTATTVNLGAVGSSTNADTVHIADSTGAVTQTVTVGSLASASVTTIQGGTGNINLDTNQAGAGTVVKTVTTNSATALQVQNAAAAPVLSVSTNTADLISNSSFESGTTGWTAVGAGAAISQNLTASNSYNGNDSLQVTTGTAGTGNGAQVATNLTPGQYTLSFYAKAVGTVSDLVITGTGGSLGSPTCSIASTITTGSFTRYNCTFTSSGTNVTAITIGESGASSHTVYIDAVNLVAAANGGIYGGNINIDGGVLINGGSQTFSTSSGLTVRGSGDNSLADTPLLIQSSAGSNLLVVNAGDDNTTITGGNTGFGTAALTASSNGGTGARVLAVINDNTQTLFNSTAVNTNLIKNPTSNGPSSASSYTSWSTKGTITGGTLATDTTNPYESIATDKAVVGAINSGMQTTTFNATLTSAQYQLTAEVKCSGSFTIAIGYTDGGGDHDTAESCTTNWQQFTTHIATTTPTAIYIDSGVSTSSGTIWADAVQLIQTSTSAATNYNPGNLYLQGVVVAPAVFENQANSTNAFQVQNAGGGAVLGVDTTNGRVGIGQAPGSENLDVAGTTKVGGVNSSSVFGVTNSSSNTVFGVDTSGNAVNINPIASATSGTQLQNSLGLVLQSSFWNGSSATNEDFTIVNQASTSSPNETLAIENNSGAPVATINGNGAATFENSANSINAFQVQNASGTNVLGVQTGAINANLIANPSFESGTTGWATNGVGTVSPTQTSYPTVGFYADDGNNLLDTNITAGGVNAGVQTTSFVGGNPAAGSYVLSFDARDTAGITNLVAGFNTSTTCSLKDFTTGADSTLLTTAWRRYYCAIAPGVSVTNIFIGEGSSATDHIYIDAVQLEATAATVPTAYRNGITAVDGSLVVNGGTTSGLGSTPGVNTSAWALTVNELDNPGVAASSGGGVLIKGTQSDNLNNQALAVQEANNGAYAFRVNTAVPGTYMQGGNSFFHTASAQITSEVGASIGNDVLRVDDINNNELFAVAGGTSNLVDISNFGLGNPACTGTTAWVVKGTISTGVGAGCAANGDPQTDWSTSFETDASLTAAVTAANSGMQTTNFVSALLPSTAYQMTFWAKCSGAMIASTLTFGHTDNGTDHDVVTNGNCTASWQQFTANFSTTGTLGASPAIYVDSGSTTSGTIWIDAIQLVQTSTNAATVYSPGKVYVPGVIASPNVTLQNTVNTVTAFQVQNAAGTPEFTVDTAGGNVVLGKVSAATGNLQLANSSSANLLTLQAGNTSGSGYTLQLPTAGTGTANQCLESNTGTTTSLTNLTFASCGSGVTLQTAYNASTSPASIVLNNAQNGLLIQNPASNGTTSTCVGSNVCTAYIQNLSTGTVDGLDIASAGTGADLLRVTDSTATAADVFTIGDGGVATFKSQTNSPTAFQIQNSSAVALFTADTTTQGITVNGSAITATLSVRADATQTVTQTYTTAGTQTLALPNDVSQITVTAWGAGGGGGSGSNSTGKGGSGGGGGFIKSVVPVTPGSTLTIGVGTAGAKATGNEGAVGLNAGNGGGMSYIQNGTSGNNYLIEAPAGGGGGGALTTGAGGQGGGGSGSGNGGNGTGGTGNATSGGSGATGGVGVNGDAGGAAGAAGTTGGVGIAGLASSDFLPADVATGFFPGGGNGGPGVAGNCVTAWTAGQGTSGATSTAGGGGKGGIYNTATACADGGGGGGGAWGGGGGGSSATAADGAGGGGGGLAFATGSIASMAAGGAGTSGVGGTAGGSGDATYATCGTTPAVGGAGAATAAAAAAGNPGCVVIKYTTSTSHTSALNVETSGGADQLRVADNGSTLLKNSTDGLGAFQVQNSTGDQAFDVNTATSNSNLGLTNPSFETGTTGWVARTGCTLSQSNLARFGNYSGKCTNTATANAGMNFPLTLVAGVQYTFSFYAQTDGTQGSVLDYGYAYNGSDEATDASTGQFLGNGWQRFTLTFTPATISGSPYLFISTADTVARNMYIDAVQIETGPGPGAYQDGTGVLPVITNTLQLQPASGTGGDALIIEQNNGGQTPLLDANTSSYSIGIATQGVAADLFEVGQPTTPDFTATAMFTAVSRTQNVLVLQAAPSQSVDNFQIQNSGGTLLDAFTSGGNLNFGQASSITTTAGALSIKPNGTSNVVIGTSDTTGTLLVLDTDTDATFVNGSAAGTNAPTEVDGGIFYSSTSHTFECGESSAWVSCIGGLRDSATAPSAIAAAVDTNFSGSGNQYTIPANDCVAGRVYRVTAYGTWINGTTATTGTMKWKFGATTISTLSTQTLTVSQNFYWQFAGAITCIDATHIEAEGNWYWWTAAGTMVQTVVSNTATLAQVASGSQLLTLSAAVSQTTGAPNITERQLIVEGLGP